MVPFHRYYRMAICEEADVRSRWRAFEACLATLDKLATELGRRWDPAAPGAMPRDAVTRAVCDELGVRPRTGGPTAALRLCSLFVVVLRFRLLHEANRYGVERRKEKSRGVRSPRRPAFTEAQIRAIVRGIHSRLKRD